MTHIEKKMFFQTNAERSSTYNLRASRGEFAIDWHKAAASHRNFASHSENDSVKSWTSHLAVAEFLTVKKLVISDRFA